MSDLLIKNARIVNEGRIFDGHILIHGEKVHSVLSLDDPRVEKAYINKFVL